MREALTRLNLTVLNILILLAAATLWMSSLSNYGVDDTWASGFFQNFSTEMFGAFATLILVEIVIGASQREQDTKRLETLRAAVTNEMRRIQQANAIGRLEAAKEESVEARRPIVDEMQRLDLLKEAYLPFVNLQEAKLREANLEGAYLISANLQRANLENANLQGANLGGANLQGAGLQKANLQEAVLGGANLQEAELREANLEGAELMYAKLQGANLERVNLQGAGLQGASLKGTSLRGAYLQGAYLENANLEGAELMYAKLQGANLERVNLQGASLQHIYLKDAKFDYQTVLPDGTKWTPDTDITRFTDPQHPKFWRSDNSGSPAYPGDEGRGDTDET